MLFLAWKLALLGRVRVLRGNHETAGCSEHYGFWRELQAKYGRPACKREYDECKRLFAGLPLAALVLQSMLVLHGGLFRPPSLLTARQAGLAGKRGRPGAGGAQALGALEDLRRADRGGQNPVADATRLAADVLWSDPMSAPGFKPNLDREIGMKFGPDVTERFLRENGLKLILRSHKGLDAREEQGGMPPMTEGWSLDHDTPSGKLYTVFSAPEYPHILDGPDEERCHNKGAVAVLNGPDFASPRMVTFEAELPRPEVAWLSQAAKPARKRRRQWGN